MPATPQAARWFVDENSLGVAKALAYVRGDITWPGAPDGPVPAGAADTTWLPVIGQAGLVVLTHDKRIRSRPLERQALLGHNVRACFLTSGGSDHQAPGELDQQHVLADVEVPGPALSPGTWAGHCCGRGDSGTRRAG